MLSGSEQASIKKILDKGNEPDPITVGASSPTRSNFQGSPTRRGGGSPRTGSPRTGNNRRRKTPQKKQTPQRKQRRSSNNSEYGSDGAGSDGEPYASGFEPEPRSNRSPRSSPRSPRSNNTRTKQNRTKRPPHEFEEDSMGDFRENERRDPSRSPVQTPKSPRSGGVRRRMKTQFEKEEDKERLQERQHARMNRREEQEAMEELRVMEERAYGTLKFSSLRNLLSLCVTILVCNYRENTSLSSIIIINVFSVIIAFKTITKQCILTFILKLFLISIASLH